MVVRSVGNFDAKLKLIPNWAVNFVVRKFAFTLFKKMLSKANNYEGSPWHKNMVNSPDFYDWIDKKISIYFSDHGNVAIINNP